MKLIFKFINLGFINPNTFVFKSLKSLLFIHHAKGNFKKTTVFIISMNTRITLESADSQES